jgi:peptidoglycan hydrolase-like protein with peptidoglycan-binding domain
MPPEPPASSRSVRFSQDPDLYPWDVGPAVAEMQDLLRAHGYSVRIDGDFGWKTEVLVKAFQRKYRLHIDGVVGRETWNALKATVQPGTRVLKQGLSGADVAELQGLLQVNGYLIDRSGHFDTATREAVIQFQQQHHLRDDGIVTGVMWTLLQGRKEPGKVSKGSFFNRIRRDQSSPEQPGKDRSSKPKQ